MCYAFSQNITVSYPDGCYEKFPGKERIMRGAQQIATDAPMRTSALVTRLVRIGRWLVRPWPLTIPGLLDATVSLFAGAGVVLMLIILTVIGAPALLGPQHINIGTRLLAIALYLASLGLLVFMRTTPDVRALICAVALCVAVSLWLTGAYAGDISQVPLEMLLFFVILRLPLRWSLPVATPVVVALLFVVAQHDASLQAGKPLSLNFWLTLAVTGLLAFGAFSLRTRNFTMQELRATQERLRQEMSRNEQLAVARERARIARDMHDVLAHSLTLLSIQTQAARQLDQMAETVRESVAESRRMVGVLREVGRPAADSPLSARLRTVIEHFTDRSGVRGSLEELGVSQPLEEEYAQALQFALQEALTNAFKHGAARHVWATLRWEPGAVTLDVRDDGSSRSLAVQSSDTAGGGNGLHGMRERATLLGGSLNAGPQADDGFAVRMRLPFETQASTGAHSTSADQAKPAEAFRTAEQPKSEMEQT